MDVTHVISSLARENGGPSYVVQNLASAGSASGLSVKVRTIKDGAVEVPILSPVEVRSHPAMRGVLGKHLCASASLANAIREDMRLGTVVHVHGLWLMPNVYPAWAAGYAQSPKIVHSVHGMLSSEALSFSKWKKVAFWRLVQRSALGAAQCLHATAPAEYEQIRAQGLRNPVAMIPNGIDILPVNRRIRSPDQRTVLFLGRIHPIKNVDTLIRAWSALGDQFPHWTLRIVGPVQPSYRDKLQVILNRLEVRRVVWAPPAFGDAKAEIFSSADLFVLPSRNENFGLSIAEALAAGIPVITTKGTPWREVETKRCGWWIDQDVQPLASALEQAMRLPTEELEEMGVRGQAWMARDYAWEAAAASMSDVYKWVCLKGELPQCVIVD